MKHLFLMDPLDQIKIEKDTTFSLMLGAQAQGDQMWAGPQEGLEFKGQRVRMLAQRTEVHALKGFDPQPPQEVQLDDFDVIWFRSDPPVDRRYFYTTLLLDRVDSRVKIVNRPQALRDWNEKLCALLFQDYIPETWITSHPESIIEFAHRHQRIVVKPIDGFGGRGIYFLDKDQPDLAEKIQEATHRGRHRMVVNPYLDEASQGDKRILLVDGEPIGGILRKAVEGQKINNLDQGGQASPAELTARELEVCQAMKPFLVEQGLFFVGIDFLGPYLTEINVTSPTGLQELVRFSGKNWNEVIIQKLASSSSLV